MLCDRLKLTAYLLMVINIISDINILLKTKELKNNNKIFRKSFLNPFALSDQDTPTNVLSDTNTLCSPQRQKA